MVDINEPFLLENSLEPQALLSGLNRVQAPIQADEQFPIEVIGIGVSELALLSEEAKKALASAEIIFGSERQCETIKAYLSPAQALYQLPKLRTLKILIKKARHKKLAILATGDPLHFGIGHWLVCNFGSEQVRVHSALSSIQILCQRLGFAQETLKAISLHGRPTRELIPNLSQNQNIIALTDAISTPQKIAGICLEVGLSQATIFVGEQLGYSRERIRKFKAVDLHRFEVTFAPLNLVLIQSNRLQGWLPKAPGLADKAFETGRPPGQGMLTKREVRLVVLSMMQVKEDDIVWDIGAGCGGISVELAYWNRQARIYAVECHLERLSFLEKNAEKFGVSANIHRVPAKAPDALVELPQPSKVVIGGSGGRLVDILSDAWNRLLPNGILVGSAITEVSKSMYQTFLSRLASHELEDVEIVEVAVAHGAISADQMKFQSKRPVTLFKAIKKG